MARGSAAAQNIAAYSQPELVFATHFNMYPEGQLALSTVRWQKMFRMRVNKATIGQWSAKYIAGMRAAACGGGGPAPQKENHACDMA
jgi:hypothetical protein